MSNEINSADAREEAALYGEVIGSGDAREDGGWDFVVDTDDGETIVSIVRDETTGLICSMVM